MHSLTGRKQTPEHIRKRMLNQAMWRRGRYWLGKSHSLETKLKISESKKASSATVRGDKHHNWRGGVTPSHSMIRNSLEYELWRDSVYARDKWTCQRCGIHCEKGNIVAHHIEAFSYYAEKILSVLNGVTLCRKCHAVHHNDNGIFVSIPDKEPIRLS